MSNLTYNPNVDIPPYHFDGNDGPRAMEFPSDGNFRGGRQPDVSYNVSYDMNPQYQQQPHTHNQQYREQQYDQQYDRSVDVRYEQYDSQKPRPKRKMKERMTAPVENPNKFNWILLLKKLVIYTVLFLVFNHIKTHEIFCGLIPFLRNNEVLCMTFKGLIFAVIIAVLLPIVL